MADPQGVVRSGHPFRGAPDMAGERAWVAGMLAACLAVLAVAWRNDDWIQGFDTLTQSLGWWSNLGQQLRDGDLPGWNPWDSGGEPLAATPMSGWLNVPVMVAFVLFPPVPALKIAVGIYVLLAALGMYGFTRGLGLVPVARVVAGLSFAPGPVLSLHMNAAPPFGQWATVTICALATIDAALAAPTRSRCLAWSAAAGLALAHATFAMPAMAIYTAGIVGGWVTVRWAMLPASHRRGAVRIVGFALGASGLFTAGYAAGVLVPIFAFAAHTPIAGNDYANVIGGDYATAPKPVISVASDLLKSGEVYQRQWFMSGTILVLAIVGILRFRPRAVSFFLTGVLAVVLIIGIAPGFILDLPVIGEIIAHRPSSSLHLLGIVIPILAGCGCHAIAVERRRVPLAVAVGIAVAVLGTGLAWTDAQGHHPGAIQWVLVAGTGIAVAVVACHHRDRTLRIASAAAIVAIVAFPVGFDAVRSLRDPGAPGHLFARTSEVQSAIATMAAMDDPGTAAAFLQEQFAAGQPFRYAIYPGTDTPMYVLSHRTDPAIVALMPTIRASRMGVPQVHGYSPTHASVMVEYFDIINGQPQDYHTLDFTIRPLGGSQLMDMLGVRYIVVPASWQVPAGMLEFATVAFRDDHVVVYDNPRAYPFAWLVHEVRPASRVNTMDAMNSYLIDGRYVALVDGTMPRVSPAAGPESVTITAFKPGRIAVDAHVRADGLLVISSTWLEGWQGYIDGEPVETVQTNHALTGIPLPAGEHTVELRYAPASLRWSTALTGVTVIVMVASWIAIAIPALRHRF